MNGGGITPNSNAGTVSGGAAGGCKDGCCTIIELCYSKDDPNYNPCALESTLRIQSFFTESTPSFGDSAILISATRVIDPPKTVMTDVVGYDVTDVFGDTISSLTGESYFEYADLLGGDEKNLIGQYSISAKKKNSSAWELTVRGATQNELGFDTLVSGQFTVLVKDLPGLQWLPKRLVLLNDNIVEPIDIAGGFKFDYIVGGTSGSSAINYWLSETAYKFNTRGRNKFFDGKKFTKTKIYNNWTANEPSELSFVRTVNMSSGCETAIKRIYVTVTDANYPYNTDDTLVQFPVKLTFSDAPIQ